MEKELRDSGFGRIGRILQACRAENHWRSRGALDTFGYIWMHLDASVAVWIHLVHLQSSTFDAAFDAYVLVRNSKSDEELLGARIRLRIGRPCSKSLN